MVTVARLLLSSLAGLLVMFLASSMAAACSCVELTTEAQVEKADVVVRGIVERIEVPDEAGLNAREQAVYTLRPTHLWKGDVVDVLTVESAPYGAACGLEGFHEGSDIVLFATDHGEGLTADLCGGTTLAAGGVVAEVTDILGEGQPMDVAPPSDDATGCTCEEASVGEKAAEADLVARVVVEHVNLPVPGNTDHQPAIYTMRPTYVWKGDVISQFKVASEPSGTGCGLEGITEGQDLVVFAHDKGDGWSADLCGGTAPATETFVAELLEVVGPGVAPDPDPGDQPGDWVWPTVAAAAGVILVGSVVARWWFRPRKPGGR